MKKTTRIFAVCIFCLGLLPALSHADPTPPLVTAKQAEPEQTQTETAHMADHNNLLLEYGSKNLPGEYNTGQSGTPWVLNLAESGNQSSEPEDQKVAPVAVKPTSGNELHRQLLLNAIARLNQQMAELAHVRGLLYDAYNALKSQVTAEMEAAADKQIQQELAKEKEALAAAEKEIEEKRNAVAKAEGEVKALELKLREHMSTPEYNLKEARVILDQIHEARAKVRNAKSELDVPINKAAAIAQNIRGVISAGHRQTILNGLVQKDSRIVKISSALSDINGKIATLMVQNDDLKVALGKLK